VTEPRVHLFLVLAVFGLALATFLALLFVVAPYGRHHRPGWGPSVGRRLGWLLMELPASVLFLVVFLLGDQRAQPVPLALLCLWELHYLHRTFVFPWRLRGEGRPMPLLLVALGFLFNCLNAYVNARWISHLGGYDAGWLHDPRFVAGVALFLVGFAVNLRADSVLLRLRARGGSGYRLPHGGLFDLVACPNYLGEIVEWFGWALAAWSLPGLAFAVYTSANLIPRALAHRRWYQERFPEEYPSNRRALIPWVL
jgi:protein-S-isoprenylcysteine O-methyltransferase Ste14